MAVLHTIANEWRFLEQKNGGKQSFNAPFSASHLEKTRISASDFASQSRTNEKPPVVRRGNPKRIQNRQAFHCGNSERMLNRQGFHCGNSKRMQNRRASSPCPPRHPSRTLPTNEWRKFIRFRNKWRKLAHYSAGSLPQTNADPPFVLRRKKPPVIQIGKTEERMEIRQSFGANGKMNARGFAIRSQAKENRQSSRSTQASGRQLTAANSR